jgi:hypothetical protein
MIHVRYRRIVAACFLGLTLPLFGLASTHLGAEDIEKLAAEFRTPPPDARPWVYWFWINGNITREGITADLEAMQRAGIGGVLIMEMDDGAPVGPATFAGPEWIELFKHACAEADRLGLEVNMNNGLGWGGSGGPWISPELSMQKLTWSETPAEGPRHLEAALPSPPVVRGFYRDIKVLAFPEPSGNARIKNLAYKACFALARPTPTFPLPVDWPETPAAEVVASDRTVDLSEKMDSTGKLTWDVPEGKWTILRMGHTSTGAISPGPDQNALECDKMSEEAAEASFAGLMDKLIEKAGPLTGKSLAAVHIDSWECGSQNWTPKFREEFERRQGYDLLPYLPVVAGRIVRSREISERFLWDFRQTINELVLENYASHFREMAHRNGLRLTVEPYTTCPCDELSYAGRADEPMCEVWPSPRFLGAWTSPVVTSGGHVWGKKIIGAESFSSDYNERWLKHPAILKEFGDWAFCEGVNRLVVHRYAMQPWKNVRPGMSMGPWGVHYERTQTWWEMSTAWHQYLARCQHLLRQGLFTADVCYLGGEGMPQSLARETRFMSKSPLHPEEPRDRTGYNFDVCPPEALLTRMSVKDGRLVLPDGMSYRLLVLPMVETMTPELLGKIKDLIEAGATVVGSRPLKSPSLSNYPECDREMKRLTEELWGSGEAPVQLTERKIGKGRLFWSAAFQKRPEADETPAERLGPAQWIWYPDGDNPWSLPAANRYFRRAIEVDASRKLKSAQLLITADESAKCWLNGQMLGGIESPLGNYRFLTVELGSLLKPGKNLLAIEGLNGIGGPNPAGVIGSLRMEYDDGFTQNIYTDKQWESAQTVKENWTNDAGTAEGWIAAKEFGALSIRSEYVAVSADTQILPEEEPIAEVMAKLGMPPDFDFQSNSGVRSLRFTHRSLDGADIYFVANKLPQPEEAICAFRVRDKRPEFWRPDTGEIECPAVFDESNGIVRLPISFAPLESVFVVFRNRTAPKSQRIAAVSSAGKEILGTAWKSNIAVAEISRPVDPPGLKLTVDADRKLILQAWQPGKFVLHLADGSNIPLAVDRVPPPMMLDGSWEVRFAPGGGAPERVVFDKLISWSEHADPGIKYFSGAATYKKTFSLAPEMTGENHRLTLSLGDVQIMAEVILNGKNLGIFWKPPFELDISDAAIPGANLLEVKVVNLWANRQVGDEFLPEDSDRNPDGTLRSWPQWLLEGRSSPAGRHSFTTFRLWRKDDPLQPSGLLGPVRIAPSQMIKISDVKASQ